jgi:hypothetical protein
MAATNAEFTLTHRYPTNRTSAVRWVLSHALRKWPLWIFILGGALGNASLAAVQPLLIGQAFNMILENPPRVDGLLGLAFWLHRRRCARSRSLLEIWL